MNTENTDLLLELLKLLLKLLAEEAQAAYWDSHIPCGAECHECYSSILLNRSRYSACVREGKIEKLLERLEAL